jgi:hypothetical protein
MDVGEFETTQWSLIVASAGRDDASIAALENYRAPVLSFYADKGTRFTILRRGLLTPRNFSFQGAAQT